MPPCVHITEGRSYIVQVITRTWCRLSEEPARRFRFCVTVRQPIDLRSVVRVVSDGGLAGCKVNTIGYLPPMDHAAHASMVLVRFV